MTYHSHRQFDPRYLAFAELSVTRSGVKCEVSETDRDGFWNMVKCEIFNEIHKDFMGVQWDFLWILWDPMGI